MDARETLKNWFIEYHEELMRFMTFCARDAHQAADIVQETYVRAYLKFHLFKPDKGSLKTWIFKNEAFGGGGTILILMAGGIFAGGWAMSRSHAWGKFLLKYLFSLWALIIVFELSHRSIVAPDTRGIVNIIIISLFVLAIFLLERAYRKRNIVTLRVFAGLNLFLTLMNILASVNLCAGARLLCDDRHVQYFSMAILAALLMQAFESTQIFMPLIKSKKENF